MIDAKVEGDQWKEIMNQAQKNDTIGKGLQTIVSKVKQMLTEINRGCRQDAEFCLTVTQSFDAFMINETTDVVLSDANRTSASRLVPVGLYVIMVLAHAMFAFSCKIHIMIFERRAYMRCTDYHSLSTAPSLTPSCCRPSAKAACRSPACASAAALRSLSRFSAFEPANANRLD